MPNVQLVQDNAPEVKQLFDKIKQNHGDVPPPFRAMANHPQYLELVMKKMDVIMGSTEIDTKTKLAVAFVISTLNNCEYCINMYSKQLKNAGFTDKQFVELVAMIDLVGSMNHFNNAMMLKPESGGGNVTH